MSLSHQFKFANNFYRDLTSCYQTVRATPLANSQLIAYSSSAGQLLGLPDGYQHSQQFLDIFSGQVIPEGGHHIAQVYAGHQFGHYVPQLGDGRSIFIGEAVHGKQSFDIHLKGAGQTPFSRMGDGRAVLRSTIREYLASEVMAALNIPTTRALCIIASDQPVYRERVETGAIMTRLAESHIRFGNFEYLFHNNKQEQLQELADFCIEHHYPDCKDAENPYLALLTSIIKRTAILIAKWQAAGFCHGVMNTDNMSIIGLTLDYGPFAFMDDYQPGFVCNHSDDSGRYAFDQQPGVGLWNLHALSYTFTNWLSKAEIEQAVTHYEPTLVQHYLGLMQQKMGLNFAVSKAEEKPNLDDTAEDDRPLLSAYLRLLDLDSVDYSLAFRLLNTVFINDQENQQCQALLNLFNNNDGIIDWLSIYRSRLAKQNIDCQQRHNAMNSHNPLYVLRNYLAQQAIDQSEQGDHSELNRLLTILSTPYTEQAELAQYADSAPPWGKNLEISCSS